MITGDEIRRALAAAIGKNLRALAAMSAYEVAHIFDDAQDGNAKVENRRIRLRRSGFID